MPSPLLSIVPAALEISHVLPTTNDVTIKASLVRSAVDCPECGLPSRRLYGHCPRVIPMGLARARRRRSRCPRWHLLSNLGKAVRAIVDRHHGELRRAAWQMDEPTATLAAEKVLSESAIPKVTAVQRRR